MHSPIRTGTSSRRPSGIRTLLSANMSDIRVGVKSVIPSSTATEYGIKQTLEPKSHKEPLNFALTLRSGKELNPILRRNSNTKRVADLEEIEAEFEDSINDTRNTVGLCRDSPIMIDENEVMDAGDSEDDKQEKSENSNKSKNLAKDKNKYVLVNTDTCIGHNAESASKQKSEEVQKPTERVYKPKIPFPRNPRKSKQELYEAKCRAILEKLTVEIPLMDAIKTTPVVKRCLNLLAWQASIYELWAERNSRLHRNIFRSTDTIIHSISTTIRNRINSFRAQNPTSTSNCFQLRLSFDAN
ncbi:hypothetical protein V5N11_015543 [Cardamine amara subsp. amara]|uniref:Uncharacterized protein n=1 Tax=Cardamine amara subsp. amara TaxID=228776 RepID=A0ABD0Z660_CARAN